MGSMDHYDENATDIQEHSKLINTELHAHNSVTFSRHEKSYIACMNDLKAAYGYFV